MAGALVVEAEAPAVVADLDDPAGVVDPPERAGRSRRGGGRSVVGVGRAQRVLGQQVLGVHQQQLLVLLLVVAAELDEGPAGVVEVVEPRRHPLVDRLAGRRPTSAQVGRVIRPRWGRGCRGPTAS